MSEQDRRQGEQAGGDRDERADGAPRRRGDEPWRTEGLPKGSGDRPRRPQWVRWVAWIVGGYLVLFLLTTMQDQMSGGAEAIAYTEFTTQVEKGNVAEIFARGDTMRAGSSRRRPYRARLTPITRSSRPSARRSPTTTCTALWRRAAPLSGRPRWSRSAVLCGTC